MRKKIISILIALVTISIIITLGGCGGKESSQTDKGKAESQKIDQNSAGSSNTYVIASGGTGGNYYRDASGIADVLSKKLGHSVTSQVTGAAAENVRLTSNGKALMGMITVDVAYDSYRGQGKWKDEKLGNIMGILPGFESANHILVRADSPIKTVQDLKGKRVSLGAPGSGSYLQNLMLLEALGFTLDDIKNQPLSMAESVEALKDGNLDAALMFSAVPHPATMDFVNTVSARLIPVSEDIRKSIKQKNPYETLPEIPGGVYKGIDQPVPTYGFGSWLVTTEDAPEDLIYNITKTIVESNNELKAISASTATWGINDIDNLEYPIPLHPGAERYFKEKGISFKVLP